MNFGFSYRRSIKYNPANELHEYRTNIYKYYSYFFFIIYIQYFGQYCSYYYENHYIRLYAFSKMIVYE